jgi:hypothetical protein
VIPNITLHSKLQKEQNERILDIETINAILSLSVFNTSFDVPSKGIASSSKPFIPSVNDIDGSDVTALRSSVLDRPSSLTFQHNSVALSSSISSSEESMEIDSSVKMKK